MWGGRCVCAMAIEYCLITRRVYIKGGMMARVVGLAGLCGEADRRLKLALFAGEGEGVRLSASYIPARITSAAQVIQPSRSRVAALIDTIPPARA